ncbi:hypothetical protein ABRG53_3838 [Pseudanabaena sp. ABRG5-3]|nr:hypothetical protein ABRG53_3838 [Pseudanabaena sp. ABRG5-3]
MVLYKVEESIQAVEAIPENSPNTSDRIVSNEGSKVAIAQVRISRLLSAEQALERITPLK